MKEITFEDIKKANENIKTTAISRVDKKSGKTISKEYAEVNQRVKAFRMVYPRGAILTEMIGNENGVCIFRAKILSEDGLVLGTGTAYEKETASFINQTSYIENCETSAVGRALGMAGFGIDTSIASAEEVQNAINSQETIENQEAVELLAQFNELVVKTDTDVDEIYKYFKVANNAEMTNKQLQQAITILEKKVK